MQRKRPHTRTASRRRRQRRDPVRLRRIRLTRRPATNDPPLVARFAAEAAVSSR